MLLPPVPEPRDLLPPLLTCLPTSSTLPQPAPALLPLLAPTLRQRITYLGRSTTDGWVKLLNWNSQQADKLPSLIERLDLEPHPVSGEVEIDDVRAVRYRRLDDETLQARLEVDQFDLLPIYVWCENDEHGQTGPGWKLTELKSLADLEDGSEWYDMAGDANEAFLHTETQRTAYVSSARAQSTKTDDVDDDYWAAYDTAPAETPGLEHTSRKPSRTPARPGTMAGVDEEDDYYARYGSEVQPALDAHDPDEEQPEAAGSTLTGTQQGGRPEITIPTVIEEDTRPAWDRALYPHKVQAPHDSAVTNSLAHSLHSELNMPRPISPASSSRSIERLEEQAAAMSDAGSSHSRVELGIKQHISTDIKSLFRLAKTAGMTKRSFEQLVKRELDVLSMLDDE